MAAEIKRTQDAIDRMDIPNKLEGLRKTLEIKPTTHAAAAAKPKLQAAAKPQVPGPKIAAAHTLIVSSRCANHTSDQVVKAIREVEARVRYRRRAKPLECHPVLEVSPALYTRLIKPATCMGLQRRPVWDQSPLVQCSRCLGFGHSKKWCREQNDKCAHCGGDHTGPTCPDRKAAQPQSA
ncbi:hypothetical protein EVAR_25540_1 [Eumeta japonica]|uniref:Nucleic-acid-binding protein from transposon X-element n=1 Tax=Eumeta variegata TaxID=151549 RepID=A0A4C1VL46_EUMVA|nr:hypothetical protein EVAR_25540_1 [Eumeta japonica]